MIPAAGKMAVIFPISIKVLQKIYAAAKRPSRKEKAAEAQNEQRAKAAAPRTKKAASSRTRGRRNDPYACFEKNEPRVDAHTPSRAYALSEEAAARIRKKVEDALAARAQRASAPAQPAKKNTKTAVHRRRRSAK